MTIPNQVVERILSVSKAKTCSKRIISIMIVSQYVGLWVPNVKGQ